MTDYVDIAIKYGGFTSLDRRYLTNKLSSLNHHDKLAFITPPPSVVNAYFAEIYQKQGPKAATAYYFELTGVFDWFNQTSFNEEKPFVRLNLSGKSYGFSYENDKEVAQVFSEVEDEITNQLLFELALIFPHYLVFVEESKIKMQPHHLLDLAWKKLGETDDVLTDSFETDAWLKLQGFNQETLAALASNYQGQKYYHFSQNQAVIYIKK